jgi:hypothetical protein
MSVFFAGNENPTGNIDGSNTIFTLSNIIVIEDSIVLVKNGVTLTNNIDYSITGASNQTILMNIAPIVGDSLTAFYEYATSEIAGGYFLEIPSGNINGNNTSFILSETPTSNNSIRAFYNGLLQSNSAWSLLGNTITFGFTPDADSTILAMYRTSFSNEDSESATYHNPIILNGNDIIYGTGETISFQVEAEDFEYNTLIYSANGTSSIPGNITINSISGLISGYIDRSNTGNYSFDVTVAKEIMNTYSTTTTYTLDILSPYLDRVKWFSNSNIGNVIAGRPSSLQIYANVIPTFTNPNISLALANCTLKLQAANISDGGENFSVGNFQILAGGICSNNANIIISSVDANGAITSVSITPFHQEYTELPDDFEFIWENPDGDSKAATLFLNFGIDTINITDAGNYYDTAIINFGNVGQSSYANAIPYINFGRISNVGVIDSGNYYTDFPTVTITSGNVSSAINPIVYTVTSGNLPDGLLLGENGMLRGMPYPSNANSYTITVQAETAYENFNMANTKEFTLQVISPAIEPLTNLSLEFFTNDDTFDKLQDILHNNLLIPSTDIFRQDDFYFGIPNNLRMLVAYGISPTSIDELLKAINYAHYPKKYLLNNLRWAQSTTDNYEVIYIQPLDDYTTINYDVLSDNSNIASIPNMQYSFTRSISDFNSYSLPSWMTDYQPDGNILGYVSAIPLIYIKTGKGKKALNFLQQWLDNNLPLNQIEIYSDRYVWNCGYCENWKQAPTSYVNATITSSNIYSGNIIINTALPEKRYSNLYPITWIWGGNANVSVNGYSNICIAINEGNVHGITGNMSSSNIFSIQNQYGLPFQVYDPSGNILSITSNINIISSGWAANTSNSFLDEDQNSIYLAFNEYNIYGDLDR